MKATSIALAVSTLLLVAPINAHASEPWKVTTRYGVTDSDHSRPHRGIDYALPSGTPIRSFTDGKVLSTRDEGHKSFGKSISIVTAQNKVVIYGHLSKFLVSKGDTIKFGQTIALSGNTGHSTGPHLHIQVNINGKDIDPRPVIGGAMLRAIMTKEG